MLRINWDLFYIPTHSLAVILLLGVAFFELEM